MLGAALSLHPGVFKVVATFKETLLRARREDLQKIHLALNTWKKWNVKEKGAEKCILHNSMLCSERMYSGAHRGASRTETELFGMEAFGGVLGHKSLGLSLPNHPKE